MAVLADEVVVDAAPAEVLDHLAVERFGRGILTGFVRGRARAVQLHRLAELPGA